MEGMLFLVWEKLWSLISTLPLISERTSILPGGTAAQITLKGTQSPLVLSSKLSGLPSLGWAGGRGSLRWDQRTPASLTELQYHLILPLSLISLLVKSPLSCLSPQHLLNPPATT